MILGQAHRLAILLVDDDDRTRRALRRHLRQHDITEADSYDAAVEALAQFDKLDIVLTDYDLGDGHTGIEVLAEAMRLHPGALRILASSYLGVVPMDRAREVANLIESKTDTGYIRMLAEL